jgi:hypothetical protein
MQESQVREPADCGEKEDNAVPQNVAQAITKELNGSERLLWSGAPRPGILVRGADAFLIPFSLLWCGFAVFWEYSVLSSRAPFFFKLWGIPFVLVGLYFVIGRFVIDAQQRAKTYYGLTNERVIIVSGLVGRRVKSLSLKTLNEVALTEKPDRSGTITFGESNPYRSMFGGMPWPGMGQYVPPSFELIPNAKVVHEMIRAAQRDI